MSRGEHRPTERMLSIIRWIQSEGVTRLECPLEVRPGQMRRVDAAPVEGLDSRLVVVLGTDPSTASATVALCASPGSEATDRDLLLPSSATTAPFDAYASVDLVATVWTDQLSGTPVSGHVSEAALDVLAVGGLLPAAKLSRAAAEAGLQVGSIQLQRGDQLWARRLREARHLAALASECVDVLSSDAEIDPLWLDFALTEGSRAELLLLNEVTRSKAAIITSAPVPAVRRLAQGPGHDDLRANAALLNELLLAASSPAPSNLRARRVLTSTACEDLGADRARLVHFDDGSPVRTQLRQDAASVIGIGTTPENEDSTW